MPITLVRFLLRYLPTQKSDVLYERSLTSLRVKVLRDFYVIFNLSLISLGSINDVGNFSGFLTHVGSLQLGPIFDPSLFPIVDVIYGWPFIKKILITNE
jgi:hypothetical protein